MMPALVCGRRPSASAVSHARRDVLDSTARAERGQRCTILFEGDFGLIAETHQGLDAAEIASAPRPFGDLAQRHRPRAGIAGVLAEGAIGAAIAADVGHGQKNFARVGDVAALGAVAHRGSRGHHARKIAVGTFDQGDGVGLAEPGAGLCAIENVADRVGPRGNKVRLRHCDPTPLIGDQIHRGNPASRAALIWLHIETDVVWPAIQALGASGDAESFGGSVARMRQRP